MALGAFWYRVELKMEEQQVVLRRSAGMTKPTSNLVKRVCVVGLVIFSILAHRSSCAPIQTPDFATCSQASYPNAGPNGLTKVVSCCPPVSKSSPVQFTPPPAPVPLRVRPAVQCADSSYGGQLEKAYQLMRALPDSDPRSLVQQANMHCAYCGGAFLQTGSTSSYEAIDIHYSWLFFPWHRMFLHFHERILQSLLNDSSFSLPFWNWDSQGIGALPSTASCQQAGNLFPQFYSDQNSSTYNADRNTQHAGATDAIINLAYISHGWYANSSEQLASNLNVMHQAMVGGGTTAETFLGSVYRAGDTRPRYATQEASGGTLEMGPHVSTHFWVAQDYAPYLDFGAPWISAYDPVFYAHHANVDRLWNVWNSLGQANFDDSDWLDAEFLFYDENAQVVRVKVSDALNMSSLGYEYESVDDSWQVYNASSCGTMDAEHMLEQLQRIPQPQRPTGERVILSSGGSLNAILKRTPSMTIPPVAANYEGKKSSAQSQHHRSSGSSDDESDEMLIIRGIHFDPNEIVSFDVFLNLPEADARTPQSCAEYVGRFHHLPLLHPGNKKRSHRRQFMWKVSVTRTLRRLRMDTLPSLLVTLVSSHSSSSHLSFRSISIERQRQE